MQTVIRDRRTKKQHRCFLLVYYAEKGDKMLHHFKGKIDIGTGNGGIQSVERCRMK